MELHDGMGNVAIRAADDELVFKSLLFGELCRLGVEFDSKDGMEELVEKLQMATGSNETDMFESQVLRRFLDLHESKKPRQEQQQHASEEQARMQVEFIETASRLKRTVRTGWALRGVPSPESVADHSFGVGLLSMLIEDESMDNGKLLAMGLLHDLAEAITGDIAPSQGVSESEKHKLEREGLDKMLSQLGKETKQAQFIKSIWEEYEERQSPEAKLIKDLDRFDMIVTAKMYETIHPNHDLSEFFVSVKDKIKHPQVRSWEHVLRNTRSVSDDNT